MSYKHEPHQSVAMRGMSHVVCARCGLVYLKNSLTDWHIRMGCQADEHPDALRVRVELVRSWQRDHPRRP